MSASAPAGSVNKKNGNDATVDINDKKMGVRAAEFIAQVAAVSWAATHVPEIRLAIQRFRNTGFRSALQVEVSAIKSPVLVLSVELLSPALTPQSASRADGRWAAANMVLIFAHP